MLPVALAVLPSGFTTSSLSNILGVVRVPVPVTVKLSGRITGAGCFTVKVTVALTQVLGVAVVHTS